MSAEIVSVDELLKRDLKIPNYQRPYKWSTASVSSLLEDIDAAINISKHIDDCKYRIGTVILHCDRNDDEGARAIVDGLIAIVRFCRKKKGSRSSLSSALFSP